MNLSILPSDISNIILSHITKYQKADLKYDKVINEFKSITRHYWTTSSRCIFSKYMFVRNLIIKGKAETHDQLVNNRKKFSFLKKCVCDIYFHISKQSKRCKLDDLFPICYICGDKNKYYNYNIET